MTTDDDDAFDAALTAALEEDLPVETPVLSRAVLTRLAEEDRHPHRLAPVAEVLSQPVPVIGAYGLLLGGAVLLGWAALPHIGGDEAAMFSALGDLVGLTGAF